MLKRKLGKFHVLPKHFHKIRSEAREKASVVKHNRLLAFSRAWDLIVFREMHASVVIGQSDYFGFYFTTLKWNFSNSLLLFCLGTDY